MTHTREESQAQSCVIALACFLILGLVVLAAVVVDVLGRICA